MATYHRRQLVALRQALDEARFGAERTLNLRASLPTAADAVARVDAWLRQQQVEGAGEVLVITGRGNQSPGGHSVVREGVRKALGSLKRRGVVAAVSEHTPGSFVVKLAPVRALWDSPRRKREPVAEPQPEPPSLQALEEPSRRLLRELATRSLEALGVREVHRLLEAEMLKQFSMLAAGVPQGVDRERRLRAAIVRAIEEYDGP